MKTIIIIILGLIFNFLSYSQETEMKKSNVRFGLFIEQRITPIYLSGYLGLMTEKDILTPVFYSEDEQLSGTATGYEVGYCFKKINFSLIFSQSFRYDHIYFEENLLKVPDIAVFKSVNGIITDYHFVIEKSFRFKKHNNLNIRIGYSLMNRNTNYAYSEQIGEIEGEPLMHVSASAFDFTAFHFALGYEKNRLGLSLGSYITDEHNYNQPSRLLIPYIKLGYRFSMPVFKD